MTILTAGCCCGPDLVVCCLPSGACDETLTATQCQTAGGNEVPFPDCAAVPAGTCSAGMPICACCIDGTCFDMTTADCQAAGGQQKCCPVPGNCPMTCADITAAGFTPCPSAGESCSVFCQSCPDIIVNNYSVTILTGNAACQPPGGPCDPFCCVGCGGSGAPGLGAADGCFFFAGGFTPFACPVGATGSCGEECTIGGGTVQCATTPAPGFTDPCGLFVGPGEYWQAGFSLDCGDAGAGTHRSPFVGQCAGQGNYFVSGLAACDPCGFSKHTITSAMSIS